MLGLLFTSVVVIVLCSTNEPKTSPTSPVEIAAFHSDFFNALSIGILSFAMQYNVPRLFYELGFRPNDTRRPPGGLPPVEQVRATLFKALLLANGTALEL